LYIEPLSDTDSKFILTLLNSEPWIKFIGDRNVHSDENAKDYIQKINSNSNTDYWVIKLKSDLMSIGIITIIQRVYLFHKDLGFALLPSFEGQGYAFEAAQVVIKNLNFLFDDTKIEAVTLPTNFSSMKLLRKLGFEFEQEILIQKEKLQIFRLDLLSKTS
jgi:[ribosomal protein S5]-alanine N-acetyltransferase